jgi:hypothetical protein
MRALFDGVRTVDGAPPILLWNSGQRVKALYDRLEGEGLSPGTPGKGRSTWLAFGYVLATNLSRVIAVHDCDIRTYDRELLARLVYPDRAPEPELRVREGLLRPRHRSALRPRDAPVRDAAAARDEGRARPAPVARLTSTRSATRSRARSRSPPISRGSTGSRPTGGSRSARWSRCTGTARRSGSVRSS